MQATIALYFGKSRSHFLVLSAMFYSAWIFSPRISYFFLYPYKNTLLFHAILSCYTYVKFCCGFVPQKSFYPREKITVHFEWTSWHFLIFCYCFEWYWKAAAKFLCVKKLSENWFKITLRMTEAVVHFLQVALFYLEYCTVLANFFVYFCTKPQHNMRRRMLWLWLSTRYQRREWGRWKWLRAKNGLYHRQWEGKCISVLEDCLIFKYFTSLVDHWEKKSTVVTFLSSLASSAVLFRDISL